MSPHGLTLCEPALVRHCRHVSEFVGGRRGAPEAVEAAVSAWLGDGCSGMGHLKDGPELSAALHQTSPSAHAALPHKTPQVQTTNAVLSLRKGGLWSGFIHSHLPLSQLKKKNGCKKKKVITITVHLDTFCYPLFCIVCCNWNITWNINYLQECFFFQFGV